MMGTGAAIWVVSGLFFLLFLLPSHSRGLFTGLIQPGAGHRHSFFIHFLNALYENSDRVPRIDPAIAGKAKDAFV
jgi:hypothetical protein